ncbi:hypothetical protein [Luteimonas chenhongjianii]|nr:hypothetical protein [Luteimonas chenhongjianii]
MPAADDEAQAAQADAPPRENLSSRLAWVGLMLLAIPLPWRRRLRD